MSTAEPIADIVSTWFQDRIACGAIARDTEAYNQALAALPDLIGRLGAAAQALPDPVDPGEQPAAPKKSAKSPPADPPAPDSPSA